MKSKQQIIDAWLHGKKYGNTHQTAIRYPEMVKPSGSDWNNVKTSRRHLPHWELNGCTYFITFRVKDEMGFPFYSGTHNCSLYISLIVERAIWFGFDERYRLDGYVIMPNHVHLLITPLGNWSLSKIMHGIKGYSAFEINRHLGRNGTFWHEESFDRLVRCSEEWLDHLFYIHMNPAKAGLVESPDDWPFSSLVTVYNTVKYQELISELHNNNLISDSHTNL